MSWNGTHPIMTKEEAKKILADGACKRCVYIVRCGLARILPDKCSRCGLSQPDNSEVWPHIAVSRSRA